MAPPKWFSSKVHLVGVAEDGVVVGARDSIHVFRASDWKDAFRRALALGRGHEEEYHNGDGVLVRWRLKEVISLDLVQAEDIDGAEVHSSFDEVPTEQLTEDISSLKPEASRPGQTI